MVGFAAIAAGFGAWVCPPSLRSSTSTNTMEPRNAHTSTFVVHYSQPDPTTFTIGFGAVGILLILIAANGAVLRSFQLGGLKIDAEEDAAEIAQEFLPPQSPGDASDSQSKTQVGPDLGPLADAPAFAVRMPGAHSSVQVRAGRLVPGKVMLDLLGWIAEKEPSRLPTAIDVEFVARASGKGNFPWFVKFREQDTAWKVTYGGRDRGAKPTVVEQKRGEELGSGGNS